MLVLGNGGVVWAELYVPSGLAAVVVASSPFWMAGVEAFSRRRRAHDVAHRARTSWWGSSGSCVLIWPELLHGGASGRDFVLGMIALQIACLGWSLGSSYSKRHGRHENMFSATAAQMLAGGAMMLRIGTLRGEWGALGFSTRSVDRVRLSFDDRRDRRVRRLHVRAAAPAGVAGVALRVHQSGDRGRARRRGTRRAVHAAHGARRRPGAWRRGHRAP